MSAGLATLASGVLLLLRRLEGVWVYAALLVGTLAWSLGEVGLNGWSLLPRLGGPAVLGLLLLLPSVRRKLRPGIARVVGISRIFHPVPLAIAFVLAAVAGLASHALRPARVDPILQRGVATLTATPAAVARQSDAKNDSTDWGNYGKDLAGTRFSPLEQITPANISGLTVAWTYHTGPSPQGDKATLEVTPLKVDDSVYLCTSVNELISLDADTGHQRWRFNPQVDSAHSPRGACRGVAYYRVPNGSGECAERIITATIDAQLIAVDARTGLVCSTFGTNGRTSLLIGMGIVPKGYYYVSSPPIIVRGRVVVARLRCRWTVLG